MVCYPRTAALYLRFPHRGKCRIGLTRVGRTAPNFTWVDWTDASHSWWIPGAPDSSKHLCGAMTGTCIASCGRSWVSLSYVAIVDRCLLRARSAQPLGGHRVPHRATSTVSRASASITVQRNY